EGAGLGAGRLTVVRSCALPPRAPSPPRGGGPGGGGEGPRHAISGWLPYRVTPLRRSRVHQVIKSGPGTLLSSRCRPEADARNGLLFSLKQPLTRKIHLWPSRCSWWWGVSHGPAEKIGMPRSAVRVELACT